MKLYLENLIPRLKEFSLSLDKQEVFVDKQWVIIDEDLNKQTYIFRRNGDPIMALNGQVTIGKWEYIAGAKSLLIDRIQDKILLNQNFIDPAVMFLKKDGIKDDNFILANENLIPDLDVNTYLKQLYYKNNSIVLKRLKNGDYLELSGKDLYSCFEVGSYVSVNVGNPVSDGLYEFEDSNRSYLIKDGYIKKSFNSVSYRTKIGEIIVEQEDYNYITIGDKVFQNNTPAPNGKYKAGFMNYIYVKDGVVEGLNLF